MKRVLMALLALLLMFTLIAPALGERVIYADQGGVAIFAEDGKVGLVDAAGNVILPAGYDNIWPFEGDYALVWQGDRVGVARRDGTLALDCVHDEVDLCPRHLAVARQYGGGGTVETLYDLETGAAVREGELVFSVDDGYLYVFSYGSTGWGYEPPYHTDVYDADMDLVYSGAVWFTQKFGALSEDVAAVQREDGSYALLDRSFNEVVPVMADGRPEVADGCVFYRTSAENPLAVGMEALGLDRARVMRGLRRYLGADAADAEDLTGFMASLSRCGVIRPDGSRTEVPGTGMRTLGRADAPYCVKAAGYEFILQETDRYGYVGIDGAYAIPPVFTDAYPFVDGTAVVREGDAWHLIDAAGARVGDIEWTWDERAGWSLDCFAQRVIPIQVDGGYRLIDRQGNYVTDEVFAEAGYTFAGRYLMLTDGDGNICVVDGDGAERLRVRADSYTHSDAEPDALWFSVDGLFGLMGLDGQWLIEPCAEDFDWQDEGVYLLSLPGGQRVYMDRAGRQLGPAPAPDEDDFC